MKLRTGFVHSHRTPIEHLSIQRINSRLGFRGLCHLDKSDTAGLARVPVHDDRDGFEGSMQCKSFSQRLLRYRDIKVADKKCWSRGHSAIDVPEHLAIRNTQADFQKAILTDIAFSHGVVLSERPHVFSLPALWALLHIELHGLALLKALETSRSDCRGMHKNVVATLAANEAVAFGVVEPLHCSLFCHVNTVFLSIDLCWRDSEVLKADY
jgi:hypothetical protein